MVNAAPALSDSAIALLRGKDVVAVATLDPDGKPRQAVTWFRLEADGRILLNGRLPRRWCANLLRDPRVSLTVIDSTDGYRWLGLTGIVDLVVDEVGQARDDIVALANRYNDGSPDPAEIAAFRSEPRISYLVRITGVYEHLED